MLKLQKEAPGLQRQKTMDPSMLSQVYIYFSMKKHISLQSAYSFDSGLTFQKHQSTLLYIYMYILISTNSIAVYNLYFVRTRHLEHQCSVHVTSSIGIFIP